uniref:Uncharacterized protein n=1 Tax=Meloidogyne hapla TaxID=6305 RepID=A0A1I8BKV0_MELHA
MAESWELLNEACRNLKNMSEQPQQLPSHITQTIESKQIQQQITESFDIEIQKTQLDNAEQWLYETRRMLENMEESKILKTLEEQTKEKLEELRTFSKNTIDYSEFENRNNKLQQLYIQLINDINIKIELLEKTENWYLNADNVS